MTFYPFEAQSVKALPIGTMWVASLFFSKYYTVISVLKVNHVTSFTVTSVTIIGLLL